jgi:hypothetical protein
MAVTFSALCCQVFNIIQMCHITYKVCVALILGFALGKSIKWKQWMKVLVIKL